MLNTNTESAKQAAKVRNTLRKLLKDPFFEYTEVLWRRDQVTITTGVRREETANARFLDQNIQIRWNIMWVHFSSCREEYETVENDLDNLIWTLYLWCVMIEFEQAEGAFYLRSKDGQQLYPYK